MIRQWLTALTLAVLVGCSGGDAPSAPSSGGTGGGAGGGGGSGGGDTTGTAAPPAAAAVRVGNDFFTSAHNGSTNPATDTVAVGGTVTWTWTNTGNVPHSVQSLGTPSFTSSAVLTGDGSTYQVTFSTGGTYQYDCAIHGRAMSGTIVVR